MGRRGPKPTPTTVLSLRGSKRAKLRRNEPTPAHLEATPPAPARLSEDAAKVWTDAAPEMVEAGLLTGLDLHAFERLCRTHALWSRQARQLEEADEICARAVRTLAKLDEALRHLEKNFGLTPADRVGLNVPKPGPGWTPDPFSKPHLRVSDGWDELARQTFKRGQPQ